MPSIHPSAQVHPSAHLSPHAQLGPDVVIGPYVTIGAHSYIGKGSQIASHAVIGDYTTIGEDCWIYAHAIVGSPSQDLKHTEGCESYLIIGDRNRIREFVTLNRATAAGGHTRLGNDNLLMAYSHVAHDCLVGNRVVLANAATLGGHVQVGDDTVIGAMSGIHQFVQIGRLSMIGAMSRVCHDVPPFMLASGSPPKLYGLNNVGLRRAGFGTEIRKILKQAFQQLYRQNLSQAEVLAQLNKVSLTEIQELLDFIQHSRRGLVGAAAIGSEMPDF